VTSWLRDLAKLAAFAVGVYVSLHILPAEGWYIITAIALAWLFVLSKQMDRMMRAPTPNDRSATVRLVMPPPLRAKYQFMIHLDHDQIAERLQLTTDEHSAFRERSRHKGPVDRTPILSTRPSPPVLASRPHVQRGQPPCKAIFCRATGMGPEGGIAPRRTRTDLGDGGG